LEAVEKEPATLWVENELQQTADKKTLGPFLLEWLGTYPWHLTVFLKRFNELRYLAHPTQPAEALFLETTWDLLGRPEGTWYQWCESRIGWLLRARPGARALDALIQIASGVRTATELGKRIGRGRLSEALNLLTVHDLAQRHGMCWMVVDPLLRCWLSTVLITQRSSASLDGAQIRQRLESYLRLLWTQWLYTNQLPLPEQVVALFERFCDDTVSLDSKIGRLPRFATITKHRAEDAAAHVYLVADAPGKRWCATVHSTPVDEQAIATFDTFCRAQAPKPSRKVVILKSLMDQNARVLAKAANMWVWTAQELNLLMELYRQPVARSTPRDGDSKPVKADG
jgi:hypothetical protein